MHLSFFLQLPNDTRDSKTNHLMYFALTSDLYQTLQSDRKKSGIRPEEYSDAGSWNKTSRTKHVTDLARDIVGVLWRKLGASPAS